MKRPIAIVLSLLLLFVPFAAVAADWSIVRMSGEVAVQINGARPVPVSLSRGATLPSGSVLTTGANSRAMLVRAEEQMIVGPNAMIALPAGSHDRQFTNIIQGAGVVEFTVEKRNVQHFAVTTPQLAAVVKGTRFAVGVFASSGVVKVARGRVEVTALKSGQITNVLPGQEATVGPGGALSLGGDGALSPILHGPLPFSPDGSTTTAASIGNGGGGVTIPGVASVGVSGGGVDVEVLGAVGVHAGEGGINASVSGIGAVTVGNGGATVNVPGILDVEAGNGGASVTAGGGVASVVAGKGGATVSVPGVVDVQAGGGGASVNVGGAVGVSAGNGGVNVDVGGVHIGLFGR